MGVLNKRIMVLEEEINKLVNQRDLLHKNLQNIEIRIHQIVGALQELKNLNEEERPDESNTSSES